MNASIKSFGIDRLSIEEQLVLVEEIWENIAADRAAVPLTGAQRAELRSHAVRYEAGAAFARSRVSDSTAATAFAAQPRPIASA